ncbi:MAG: hypothetical protein ABII71_03725 [Candidatus Micrarchaeota archaeon]
MEIREAIGVKKGEKILLSLGVVGNGKVTVRIAKAPENITMCAYSRNGAYVKDKRGETNEEQD